MKATGERIHPATGSEMPSPRQTAEEMESCNPLWIVVFGVYTRQFIAFPRFDAPAGTVAVAGYPLALMERMRAIERALRVRDRYSS